jgi:tRNA pseudouridine38-40 synthase
VEGEIRQGLVRAGVLTEGGLASLSVASRTDRGVSARANALVLESRLPGPSLLRAMNGLHADLFFTATTPVPPEFRVRQALRRTYRYFDPTPSRNSTARSDAAGLFRGTVDVRSFGRGLPAGTPARRDIESVTLRSVGAGTLIQVRAPSFVWGMVRKIVGALREVDAGRLPIARLRSALEGDTRLTLPLAEPEPLLLWDVEYGFPWTHQWTGRNRIQTTTRERERAALWARAQLLDALADPGLGPSRLGERGARTRGRWGLFLLPLVVDGDVPPEQETRR